MKKQETSTHTYTRKHRKLKSICMPVFGCGSCGDGFTLRSYFNKTKRTCCSSKITPLNMKVHFSSFRNLHLNFTIHLLVTSTWSPLYFSNRFYKGALIISTVWYRDIYIYVFIVKSSSVTVSNGDKNEEWFNCFKHYTSSNV